MRIVRAWLTFGVFAAIIVFAIGYIGSLGIRDRLPSDRTDLSMTVPDINGLVVDSRVLLRGVPVGKVTRVDANVDHAQSTSTLMATTKCPSIPLFGSITFRHSARRI